MIWQIYHIGQKTHVLGRCKQRGLQTMVKKKQIKIKPLKKIPVTHGSENVFADLGFEDAEELQVKAGLTHQIYSRIKMLKLTQVQTGKLLGISQPDVSKLMRGRYTGYTTDRLIALLNILEVDVDIVIRPHRKNGCYHKGIVRIMEETIKNRSDSKKNKKILQLRGALGGEVGEQLYDTAKEIRLSLLSV